MCAHTGRRYEFLVKNLSSGRLEFPLSLLSPLGPGGALFHPRDVSRSLIRFGFRLLHLTTSSCLGLYFCEGAYDHDLILPLPSPPLPHSGKTEVGFRRRNVVIPLPSYLNGSRPVTGGSVTEGLHSQRKVGTRSILRPFSTETVPGTHVLLTRVTRGDSHLPRPQVPHPRHRQEGRGSSTRRDVKESG